MLNNRKHYDDSLIAPRENILRAIEKDNDFIHIITEKILYILESFSDCFSFINTSNLTSEKIEAISKFCLYFFSYFYNKNHQTPGEEYCMFFKDLSNTKNLSSKHKLIIYILMFSFGTLLLRSIHSLITKYINRIQQKLQLSSITRNEPNNLTFESKIVFISKKLFENLHLPNFDDIIEKLYEYQLMQFFLNGKYHSWFDYIFRINYIKLIENPMQKTEVVFDNSSFKFLGVLMLIKNSSELILKIKEIYRTYININKEYEMYKEQFIKDMSKITKNEKENVNQRDLNKSFLNFKVKNSQINFIRENKPKSSKFVNESTKKYKDLDEDENENENEEEKIQIQDCLLCMDRIQNISCTFCGHIFCWDCIIKYLQINNSCPFCRKICLPQNVIRLRNLI